MQNKCIILGMIQYQAIKHGKGWEEEEDDYALFASPDSKKGPKKAFKGRCGYCEEFGHKAADCPNKKAIKTWVRNRKTSKRKNNSVKGTPKAKDILICQK